MANQRRLTKWLAASLLAVFVLGLAGCDNTPRERILSVDGMTMGTGFSIKWVATDQSQVAEIRTDATTLLAEINRQMSTYIPDSDLSRLNRSRSGEPQTVPDELMFVLQEAQRISDWTSGAFDVTVGPLVNLWGFGPDGRIVHAPDEAQIEQLKTRVGNRFIRLFTDSNQV